MITSSLFNKSRVCDHYLIPCGEANEDLMKQIERMPAMNQSKPIIHPAKAMTGSNQVIDPESIGW